MYSERNQKRLNTLINKKKKIKNVNENFEFKFRLGFYLSYLTYYPGHFNMDVLDDWEYIQSLSRNRRTKHFCISAAIVTDRKS